MSCKKLVEMLGWLQNGGGINQYFDDTRLNDVLLVTEPMNNVVIGNKGSSSTKAAIYIQNNSIGVNCLPTNSYTLDVSGDTRIKDGYILKADKITTNTVFSNGLISSSNAVSTALPYKRTIITMNGLINNINNNIIDLSFFDKIKKPYDIVHFKDVSYNVMKQDIIDYTQNRYQLQLDKVPLNIVSGETITVYFQKEIKDNVTQYPVKIPVQIIQAIYNADTVSADIQVKVFDTHYLSYFLNENTTVMFSINNQKDLFLITSVSYTWNNSILTLNLRSIDNVSNISTILPFYLANLFIDINYVSALRESTVYTENNISFGRYLSSGQEVSITFTTTTLLSSFANTRDYRLNGIDSISLSFNLLSNTSYGVNSFYREPVYNRLVVNIRGLSSLPACGTTDITYTLIGTRLPINGAIITQRNSVIYDLTSSPSLIEIFENYKHLYIIDSWYTGVWSIVKIDKCNFTIELIPDDYSLIIDTNALIDRTVFCTPFNIEYQTRLVDKQSHGYFPNNVGIGTNRLISTDKLTVGGSVAIEDKITWYGKGKGQFYECMNLVSSNTFFQSYNASNNEFNINNKIKITSNATNILIDTNVLGVVTANSFSSPSDISLKTNIKQSDCMEDLKKLLQINICDFNYKSEPEKAYKGVIANEIETIIPEAVYSSKSIFPSICKWSKFRNGYSIFIPFSLINDINTGDIIRVIYKDTINDVVVNNKCDEYFDFTPEIQYDLNNIDVMIYGTFNTYKMVNYDYLFSMCINALKCIALCTELNDKSCNNIE